MVAPISEKEIPVGAGGDFDDFDKSDEDDSPKRKSKGKVKSAELKSIKINKKKLLN